MKSHDYDPSVHALTDPLFREPLECICVDSPLSTCGFLPMHYPCIRVDSLLSAREYTAPIHSTGSYPNTSMMRACWTLARILRRSYIHHGGYMPGQLLPAACGTTSIHSACTLREERPRRTAVHFFPHTRPPDTLSHPLDSGAAVEYQGPLVNTYFSLVLSSMPKKRRGYRRPSGAMGVDTLRPCPRSRLRS